MRKKKKPYIPQHDKRTYGLSHVKEPYILPYKKRTFFPPHNVPLSQWDKGINEPVIKSHVLPFWHTQMTDQFYKKE